MSWSPDWVFAYWIAPRSDPWPLSFVFVTTRLGEIPITSCENSDVLPFGSVAVALKTSCPAGAAARQGR